MNNFNTNLYETKREIINYSNKITEGLKKPTAKFIMDMLYGLSKNQSVMLSDISRALDENIKLNYTIDRLSKNLEKINYVEMVGDSQPVVFILKMNDNLSKNFMLKGAYLNAKDIIKSVYAVAGDKITSYQFVFNFPLVDMYGNEEDGKVLSFDMSKETVEKINWDNITTDNLIALSENVFMHPDLKQ